MEVEPADGGRKQQLLNTGMFDVVVIDRTYGITMDGMRLLQVVGKDRHGELTPLVQVQSFLYGESEEKWTSSQLLQSNFLGIVETAFNNLVRIPDLDKYSNKKWEFLSAFQVHTAAERGLRKILNDDKRFAYCYAHPSMTLGWSTSSAVESMHSALKRTISKNSNNQPIIMYRAMEIIDSYTNPLLKRHKQRDVTEPEYYYRGLPPRFSAECGQLLPNWLGYYLAMLI